MSTESIGLGVTDIVGIVFIVLKLTGVIGWSWLWVLSPFWISFILIGILTLIFEGS